MDAILEYGSSDNEDTSGLDSPLQPQPERSQPPPSSRSVLPAALDLLQDAPENAQENICNKHQGRVRTFPHIEGNFATHVFTDILIPLECLQPLESFLKLLQRHLPTLLPVEDGEGVTAAGVLARPLYHLSFSRTVAVKQGQIASLIASLREKLRRSKPFAITLGHQIEIFTNDDRTRTFLAFSAASTLTDNNTGSGGGHASRNSSCDAILNTILSVSTSFKLHGLPEFYENPRPHVSIAWALGDQEDAMHAALAQPRILAALEQVRQVWRSVGPSICPKMIVCRIGQKRYTVWERVSPELN